MNKASIIGSGIGGLALAIRLRLKGYKVVVFEANSSYGGKAAEIKTKGFRFDKGPSLLTMPEKIDELFFLAKKNPKEYFEYKKLNESCRYFYEDGTSIIAHAKTADFAKEVYEKICRIKGASSVALITGEEKILPKKPSFYICTVEAMPTKQSFDFVAIDEIQIKFGKLAIPKLLLKFLLFLIQKKY